MPISQEMDIEPILWPPVPLPRTLWPNIFLCQSGGLLQFQTFTALCKYCLPLVVTRKWNVHESNPQVLEWQMKECTTLETVVVMAIYSESMNDKKNTKNIVVRQNTVGKYYNDQALGIS